MNSSFCRKSAIRSSSRYCFHRRSCSREPWPRGASRQPWEPWTGGKHGRGRWVASVPAPARAGRSLQQHLRLSLAFCSSVTPLHAQPQRPSTAAPQRGPSLLRPVPDSPGHRPPQPGCAQDSAAAKGTKGDRAPLPLPSGKGGRVEAGGGRTLHMGTGTSQSGVSVAQGGTRASRRAPLQSADLQRFLTLNRGVEPRQNLVWRQGRRVSASTAAFTSPYLKSRDCNFPLINIPTQGISCSPPAPGAVAPREQQSRTPQPQPHPCLQYLSDL